MQDAKLMLYSCLSFLAVCSSWLRSLIDGINPDGSGAVCVAMSFFVPAASKYFRRSYWQYLLWSNSMSKLDSWFIRVARYQWAVPRHSRLNQPFRVV
jgi:hypothetical protein